MTSKLKILENMIRQEVRRQINEAGKRDELPPYRVEYSYISFTEKRRKVASQAWDEKRYGKPTQEKLKQFRADFNKSMQPGGANAHLAKISSGISTVTAINQRTGQVVAKYAPPAFDTL